MAETELFVKTQPGGMFSVVNRARFAGNIWFVDNGNTLAADEAGKGVNPTYPFATINYAAAACTANNGDVIFAYPGHIETISAAAGLALATAGVTIVCLGNGSNKATIKFGTDVGADMDVDAANITLVNPRFEANIDALTGPIDVNAAGFKMENVEWWDATGKQTTDCLVADANADYLEIDGWTYHEGSGGTQKQSHIQIAGATGVVLRRINITGDFATGNIENGTAWVGAFLADVMVENTNATPKPGIVLAATATGNAVNVKVTMASGTVPITADNDMQWYDSGYSTTDGASSGTIGSVLSGSIEDKVDTVTTRLGTPTNTGGTATLAAILGDPANSSIVTRLTTIAANLSGAAGINPYPAAAAANDNVSMAEVVRYIQENLLGTITNTGGTATVGGVLGDVANVSVAAWLQKIGTLANTGGTATLGGILGDPSNTSLASRLTTLQAELSGAAGITSWPAAAAPGDGVSLAEGLRYIVESQFGTLTNTGGTATLGGILGDVANVSVAAWLQKIGTVTNTGGTATLGAVLGDVANSSIATRLTTLQAEFSGAAGITSWPAAAAPADGVSLAEGLRYIVESQFGTLTNTGGTATLGAILGDFANVSVATWLQKIGTLTNTGGTATLGGMIGDLANVSVATWLQKIGTLTNTGGTATLGGILGDVANSSIATRLTTIAAELSGAAGITTWPAAAAPGDGVSLAEGLRYVVESQIGTLTNTGGTATLGGILGDVTNTSVATWLGRIGAPANTGGTATLAAILGDPLNTSLASRLVTLQAELSGATGIASWPAAAAPADGVSLCEGLRYIVESQIGTLTNSGGTATLGGILGDVANSSIATRLGAIAAGGGIGSGIARKTVTFSNTNADVDLFTVTGSVIARLVAVCTTNLESAGGCTIAVTCASQTLIANPTGGCTDLDANEIWHDNTPDASAELTSVMKEYIIAGGNDIVLDLEAAKQVDSGVLEFYLFWTALSANGAVVAA